MLNLSYEEEELGKSLHFNIPFIGLRDISFANSDKV
jgi:hypothetical protein